MSGQARKGRPPATVHYCDCGAVARCKDGSGWQCWPCGPFVKRVRLDIEKRIARQRGWVMRRGIAVPPPVPGQRKGRDGTHGADGKYVERD